MRWHACGHADLRKVNFYVMTINNITLVHNAWLCIKEMLALDLPGCGKVTNSIINFHAVFAARMQLMNYLESTHTYHLRLSEFSSNIISDIIICYFVTGLQNHPSCFTTTIIALVSFQRNTDTTLPIRLCLALNCTQLYPLT